MGLFVDEATVWTLFACPFHALTGLYCPLCGSTRAALALVHGDVLLALRCNLLLVGVVMWTAAVVARGLAAAGLGGAKAPPYNERDQNQRDLAGRGFSPGAWRNWAALMAAALFTVARNLPGTWWLRP